MLGKDRLTRRFHLDEAKTLRGWWKLMQSFNTRVDVVIGHNLMGYDYPFILKRSMIHSVLPPVHLSLARYRAQPLYDTQQVWTNWDARRSISLVELARVLKVDVTKTDGMDGSRVYDAYLEERHDEIADYCLRDVEVVRAVYRKMTFTECDIAHARSEPVCESSGGVVG